MNSRVFAWFKRGGGEHRPVCPGKKRHINFNQTLYYSLQSVCLFLQHTNTQQSRVRHVLPLSLCLDWCMV